MPGGPGDWIELPFSIHALEQLDELVTSQKLQPYDADAIQVGRQARLSEVPRFKISGALCNCLLSGLRNSPPTSKSDSCSALNCLVHQPKAYRDESDHELDPWHADTADLREFV